MKKQKYLIRIYECFESKIRLAEQNQSISTIPKGTKKNVIFYTEKFHNRKFYITFAAEFEILITLQYTKHSQVEEQKVMRWM